MRALPSLTNQYSFYSRYIQFGVLSPQNMVKIAEFEITQRDLYMPESRTPIKGGVLDLRLVNWFISCIVLLADTNNYFFMDRVLL